MSLPKVTYDQHNKPMPSHIIVGCGEDSNIRELVEAIGKTIGYQGQITFDTAKPNGISRKLIDGSPPNDVDWKANFGLAAELKITYKDFFT